MELEPDDRLVSLLFLYRQNIHLAPLPTPPLAFTRGNANGNSSIASMRRRVLEFCEIPFREEGGTGIPENGRPLLVVLRGPSFGDVYELGHEALVLGSDPFRADVVIRDIEVEPKHAKVYEDDGYHLLREIGEDKPTSVNGEEVEAAHPLRCGDRISLGDSILEYVEHDEVKQVFHIEMHRMVNYDYLTGLTVKNRFDERFEHALKASRENDLPLSILMADIDNLKKINDAHGHLLGERTIAEVGRIIRESETAEDQWATRFGGDEYQVLLPGLDKREAIEIAGEIRRRVEECAIEHGDAIADPTISFGVSAHPEDGSTRDDLTHAADEALYRAKRAGGNTVSE